MAARETGATLSEEGPDTGCTAADWCGDGPLDLRALRLTPGLERRTVTVEVGTSLCARRAASCGEIISVDAGEIDVVTPDGTRQRLGAGALLFVAGLPDIELRCAGQTPAVLTGICRTPSAPAEPGSVRPGPTAGAG